MADIAQLGFRVDSSQVRQATSDLSGMSSANTRAAKSADDLSKAGKNNSFQMRQTAMQLSQVASQGAVTGNYLQALAIQLPDLALAFGPVAIIAGALAGSLAGPMINALSGTSQGIDELIDVVRDLGGVFDDAADGSYKFSEELVRMAEISEQIARLKVASGVEEARRSILGIGEAIQDTYEDIRGSLNLTTEEAERLSTAVANAVQSKNISDYDNLAGVIADLEVKYQDATNAARENFEALRAAGSSNIIEARRIEEAGENYIRLRGALDGVRGEFTGLIQSGAEAALVFDRLNSATDNFNSLLERSVDIADADHPPTEYFEEYANAQKKYRAMIQQDLAVSMDAKGRAAQQFSMRVDMYKELYEDDLINHQQYLDAKDVANQAYQSRLEVIAEREKQARMDTNKSILSATAGFFGNMAEIAEMGGKEQFQTWKRLSQAQAAVSASLAIVNALASAPPPFNIALAGSIGALAAFQIAQIEQQEYRAREYGGQVSPGTSYIVGERGPEVLTVGSQGGVITPNSQVGGENNTVVVNVATGVQASVRAEMMSLMPTIIRTAQQVSAAQMRKR